MSDWGKQTITVLEADTGKLVKVCDVGGRTPRGLTVDDNGNVFVCYLPRRDQSLVEEYGGEISDNSRKVGV